MRRIFAKIVFVFSLLVFIFGASIKNAHAWTIILYQDNCVTTGQCSKGGSDCPHCDTPANACCSQADSWSMYNVSCVTGVQYNSLGYAVNIITITVNYASSYVYSTGDKCLGETGLRAGYCDGGYSPNIYKYCCTSSGLPQACLATNVDGKSPMEGDCPGGSVIDGVRVRSSPCVPVETCAGTCYTTPVNGSIPSNCNTYDAAYPGWDYTAANGTCNSGICCSRAACPAEVTCNSGNCGQSVANGLCSTKTCPSCEATMYYCQTSNYNCSATSSAYASAAACQSNLSTYLPGQTTGVCYSTSSGCENACKIDGVCGASLDTCNAGTSNGTGDSNRAWTCAGIGGGSTANCSSPAKMYFCRTDTYSCEETSSTYTSASDCQSNLATYFPGVTGGVCSWSCPSCGQPPCSCGDTSLYCGNYSVSGASCATNSSCTGTKSCNDGNACTTDSCSSNTCVNTPISSTDSNWSGFSSCVPSTGSCGTGTQTRSCIGTVTCGGTNNCVGSSTQNCTVNCSGGSEVCYNNSCCVPNCSCASNICSDSTCNDGCGGTCTGALNADCSNSGSYCVGTTYESTNGCGTCTGTNPLINGTNGTCGGDNGGLFASTPVNLCNSGLATGVTLISRTYLWNCNGTLGNCGGTDGTTQSCNATQNRAPTYVDLVVKDSDNQTVEPDNLPSGRLGNHTCQTQLNSNRTVRYVVTASDLDGNSDIDSIRLRLGSTVYTEDNPVDGVATFEVQYGVNDPAATYPIEVNITDIYGATSGWWSTNRDFRIWDCVVSVSGTLYDGSAATFGIINCANDSSDFVKPVAVEYQLRFGDKEMTVNTPAYSSNGNNLTWGSSYVPIFSISGSSPKMRVSGTCQNSLVLDNSVVDPYGNNQSVIVDFSSILNQEAWFQVYGGGIYSKTRITNSIPVTCYTDTAGCQPFSTVSSGVGVSDNGLVVAPVITNNSDCGNQCRWGSPNNWMKESSGIMENYSYKYFYDRYFVNLGQGSTLPGGATMTDIVGIGGTGVIFVNGNLTVDAENTLPVGKFLMVVVNGNINVSSSINKMEGVFVSNGSFNIGDITNTAVKVNGIIYSVNSNINLTRSFEDKSQNNSKPAVEVHYRPDLIFNMPSKMIKLVSGWIAN